MVNVDREEVNDFSSVSAEWFLNDNCWHYPLSDGRYFTTKDIERGNKALTYAAKLQNETGGWFGSYAVIDNPKPTDKKEYPDYIPDGEISWAVKY